MPIIGSMGRDLQELGGGGQVGVGTKSAGAGERCRSMRKERDGWRARGEEKPPTPQPRRAVGFRSGRVRLSSAHIGTHIWNWDPGMAPCGTTTMY